MRCTSHAKWSKRQWGVLNFQSHVSPSMLWKYPLHKLSMFCLFIFKVWLPLHTDHRLIYVMSLRSRHNKLIITDASRQYLIKLRYTCSKCVNCQRLCPYFLPVRKVNATSLEEIEIKVLQSCCEGIVLVCTNCIDLYHPEFCMSCQSS